MNEPGGVECTTQVDYKHLHRLGDVTDSLLYFSLDCFRQFNTWTG